MNESTTTPSTDEAASQPGLLSRIGRIFRRDGGAVHGEVSQGGLFVRHPNKHERAMMAVSQSFETLSDLMTDLREGQREQALAQREQAEAQRATAEGARLQLAAQQELAELQRNLLEQFKALPENLRQSVDVQRQSAEIQKAQQQTLDLISRQLNGQSQQNERLVDALDVIGRNGSATRETLEDLQGRLDRMRETDSKIAENMSVVGGAMNEFSKSTNASTRVLEQMRSTIDSRNGEIERVLTKQGNRFTAMLAISIFLSVLALAAVAAVGWVFVSRNM